MTRPELKADEEQAAREYADLLWDAEKPHDWPAINRAIINRWSLAALKRIKHRAWTIVERGL